MLKADAKFLTLTLQVDYDAAFIAKLKSLFTKNERRWLPRERVWKFRAQSIDDFDGMLSCLEELIKKYKLSAKH